MPLSSVPSCKGSCCNSARLQNISISIPFKPKAVIPRESLRLQAPTDLSWACRCPKTISAAEKKTTRENWLQVFCLARIFFFFSKMSRGQGDMSSLQQLTLCDNPFDFTAYCIWVLCIVTRIVLISAFKLTKDVPAFCLEPRNRLFTTENSGFIANSPEGVYQWVACVYQVFQALSVPSN